VGRRIRGFRQERIAACVVSGQATPRMLADAVRLVQTIQDRAREGRGAWSLDEDVADAEPANVARARGSEFWDGSRTSTGTWVKPDDA
jgi:hypothetical protein